MTDPNVHKRTRSSSIGKKTINFNLHSYFLQRSGEVTDSNGGEMISVVLSHVSHHSMKFKVSESGDELIVILEDKFSSAASYIDSKIK